MAAATPPRPTVSAQVAGERDGDGNYIGAATVTVNATDAGSGVARVEYALDDGPFGTYSAPVTVNSPGQHTVRFRATDVAGNTSEIGSTAVHRRAAQRGHHPADRDRGRRR